MHKQIFVNLPVKNLDRSVAFFGAIGYQFNPQFTDENATCMIVGDNLFVMLLVEPYFQSFIAKPVGDAKADAQAILALPLDDRAQVDAYMDKVLAAGASESRPAQDLGFMYQRSFEDLDGHLWEVFHFDEKAMPQQA